MDPPTGWLGTDLPGRPCDSTYCLVPFDELPPIDTSVLDGSLGWLEEPRGRLEWALGGSEPDHVVDPDRLPELRVECEARGVRLPAAFERFISTERRDWVRSPTACWLELPDRLVRLAGTDRLAVRFLNDQQSVLFWYLIVDPSGDQGVVVSNDLFDADEAWLEDPSLREVHRCAESFEAFLYRFWLESEIYFRDEEGEPLTPAMQAYAATLAQPR